MGDPCPGTVTSAPSDSTCPPPQRRPHRTARGERPSTRDRLVEAALDATATEAFSNLSLREHGDYLQGAEEGRQANLLRPMGEQRREAQHLLKDVAVVGN